MNLSNRVARLFNNYGNKSGDGPNDQSFTKFKPLSCLLNAIEKQPNDSRLEPPSLEFLRNQIPQKPPDPIGSRPCKPCSIVGLSESAVAMNPLPYEALDLLLIEDSGRSEGQHELCNRL